MSAFSQPTAESHGRCYADGETVALPAARKSAVPLVEISLAHCEDGWRAAHGFGFTGGDYWGSWSPIFVESTVHPTREAALFAEADRLRERIKDREGKEPDRIRRWLDTLAAPDLFHAIEKAAA